MSETPKLYIHWIFFWLDCGVVDQMILEGMAMCWPRADHALSRHLLLTQPSPMFACYHLDRTQESHARVLEECREYLGK